MPGTEKIGAPHLFFFFSGEVSPERARWLCDAIAYPQGPEHDAPRPGFTIFLTGESIISLSDRRTVEYWRILAGDPSVRIVADGEEIRLHGLTTHIRRTHPGISVHEEGEGANGASFWQALVAELREDGPGPRRAGFLLCQGPYMSRTPVFMLRFLKSALELGLSPELYAYLDGVHAAHLDQRPSEFENIGDGISAISMVAGEMEEGGWFGACSRCATARGYYVKNPETGGCQPSSCLPAVRVRPLREILDRFNGSHPILAECCGGTAYPCDCAEPQTPPVLNILISSSPYASEWAFGGLSMAVATAMGGMETRVLFIEQGVYALCGDHVVLPEDRVFNVQEMIMATMDLPLLRYAAYMPSLLERGIGMADGFSGISPLHPGDLGKFLCWSGTRNTFPRSRTIFF